MKKKYLMTFLLATAFIAAWSVSPPTAEAQSYYGDCGDGVIEVNPYAGAELAGTDTMVPLDPAPFGRPEAYFYNQSNTKAYTYYPNTPWSRQAGEMCDGLDSTILCWGPFSGNEASRCTLVESWPSDTNNCYYFDNSALPEDKRECGLGVGNGIIQPGGDFAEECDDGNITPGDGCSPLGKYELGEAHVEGVCGNGVIDGTPLDQCDDGNNRSGDGCSSDCTIESTHKNDGSGDSNDCAAPTCGNGRIDYALGEQCDDGVKNGKVGSECTVHCVLKSSPYFQRNKENMAWWKAPGNDDVRIDMLNSSQIGSNKNKPVTVEELLKVEKSPGKPVLSIENHGQKIVILREEAKQYAGVILSGQQIGELGNKEIFPDNKIHFNMVVSMTEKYSGTTNPRWDDDAFGLVFGMKPGLQNNNSPKYLMLSWRSHPYNDWQQAWAYPGCNKNAGTINAEFDEGGVAKQSSLHGPAGLRLYQVSGAPSYTQLWTMNEKCTTNYKGEAWGTDGNIKEIPTDSTARWTNTATYPWTAGSDAWNKVINPFLPLNTTYALDFGIGQNGVDQRLQIDAEFSKDELKVWVNRQPAIHITKANLPSGIEWPTSGQLGFYIMGMDNLTIDTSGTYSNIKAKNPDDSRFDPDKITGGSSSCSHFCGNGIVEGDEKCDDGNTVDYDGCSNDCQTKGDPTTDSNCTEKDGEVLCYGGTINRPTDGSTVRTVNIDHLTPTATIYGEYSGATDNIVVEVKDKKTGQVVCEGSVRDGSVVKKDGNKWSLDSCTQKDGSKKSINLPNGEYTATASFVPTQTTNGTTFPTKDDEATFTVDDKAVTITVERPSGDPAHINPADLSGGELTVSGTSTNAPEEVRVQVCVKGPKDCATPKNIGVDPGTRTWTGNVAVPEACKAAGAECEITFTPVKNGEDVSDGVVKKEIKVAKEYGINKLPKPEFTNIANRKPVKPNPNNTITAQGKLALTDGVFKNVCTQETGSGGNTIDILNKECEPIYVILTVSCKTPPGGEVYEYKVPVNRDLTFEKDLTLPSTCNKAGNQVYVKAETKDAVGRISQETTSVYVEIADNPTTPKISFTCPTPTNPEPKCKLPDAGEGKDGKGLVVNGQTNIHSPRTVVVKAYKKTNPDAPCKMADLAEDTPDVVVPVKTTNNGKWAADLQGLRDGSYCIVADLKSTDDKTIATTLTTAKDFKNKKSPDDVTINGAEPYFTAIGPDKNASDETKRAAGTTVAQDISDAIKNAGVTERPRVPVTIAVDPNQSEGVTGGDLCDIWVKDNPAWSGTGRFTLVDGKLVCTADLPVYNDGESLAGKTLVGVARQPDTNNVSKPTDPTLTIPGATITDNGDGTATITLDPGYPAEDGNKVTFTGKNGKPLLNDSTNQPITCILKEGEPKGTLTCKSDVPLTKDNAKIVVGADVGSAPVPARGVINGNDDGSDKPDDGTQTAGPGPVTGKVTYNNDGTATVTDIEGAKPNGTITVTPTYKDKDGNVVTGTPIPCTVQRVAGLLECQTENLGVPPGATPTKVVAKDRDQVVGTWFPKKDPNTSGTTDRQEEVTAKYIDGDDRVKITIPIKPETVGSTLENGQVIKVSSVNEQPGGANHNTFTCKLQRKGDVFECISNGPFVDKDGNQYKEIKVEVVTEGPKKPQIDIGTAYLFGDSNSTDNATGFVAGGCSTTDSPASGLVALLLAALGFFVVRRRKE